MAEAIKSANSARPSSLGSPVPGNDLAAAAQAFMDKEAAASATPPPQGADLAQAAQAFSNQQAAAPAETPPEEFAPEPGFAQANLEQLNPSELLTRIQTGLAANDNEKVSFLMRKFGDKNVKMKDGKIFFRRAQGEKLKPLDPETLELISDILPDFAREIVTEAAMLPGEVLGGTIGGLLGNAPGAVGGIYAGRVATAPLANEAADRVAQLAGVSEDPNRDKATEDKISMGLEAAAPVVGKFLKPALKWIPGTEAYKAAKKAGEREIVALSAQDKEVANAVQQLAAEGRAARVNGELVGLPGANISLMGHQLSPDNPILKNFVNQAATDGRFINAQTQLAEDWGDLAKKTLEEIGRRGNKGPYRPEKLAESVTNAVSNLEKAEGKAIGQYRAKAMAKLKNKKQQLPPDLQQKGAQLLKEFGFTQKPKRTESAKILNEFGNSYNAPSEELVWEAPASLDKLLGNNGLTDLGQARAVVNNLKELAKGMKSGMSIADLDYLRTMTGETGSSLFRTGAGAKMSSLSGDLRNLYRHTVSKGLDDDFERAAFNSAMDDFSSLKGSVETLKGALNEESSAKAIVNSFFTGKENLQKIRHIKQISPESYAALKEEFIHQRLMEFGSRDTKTGLRSSAFLDSMNKKYGNEFMREIFDDGAGPNLDTVKNLLRVTERIEKTYQGVGPDTMTEAQKKAAANAFIGATTGSQLTKLQGLRQWLTGGKGKASDSVIAGILTRDGIDKYVAEYPGKIDKKKTLMMLNDFLAEYKFYKAAQAAAKTVPKIAESDYTKRAVRAGVKEQLTPRD